MTKSLISTIENAIVLYVSQREGSEYKGNYTFDLKYLTASTWISLDRRNNISYLANLLKQSKQDNDSDLKLALNVYNYLKTIKTGGQFLWLTYISDSLMRDTINQSIFSYDPDLYSACSQGNPSLYKVKEIPTTTADIVIKPTPGVAPANTEIENLRKKLANAETKISQADEKIAGLETKLTNAIFVIEKLTGKINLLLQQNSVIYATMPALERGQPDPGIEKARIKTRENQTMSTKLNYSY
jgi:hypothetical protein